MRIGRRLPEPLRLLLFGTVLVALIVPVVGAIAQVVSDQTDPFRNKRLPCEVLPSTGLPARSARGIVHLANKCGIAGTDVELQSRMSADGVVHDYAFVGTMGQGLRIFDVTNAAQPRPVGGYNDAA